MEQNFAEMRENCAGFGLAGLRSDLKQRSEAAENSVEMNAHRGIAIAAVLLLATIALSGCGPSTTAPAESVGRAVAEAKVVAIEAELTQALTSNQGALPGLSSEYVQVLRESIDALGADDVRQRLTEQAARLGPSCPSCAQSLNAMLADTG